MNSDANNDYCVNWKNHMSHVRKVFDSLLSTKELTDVTLCCEGKEIGAHKVLLSACSTYFRETFKKVPSQHPVIIFYGVEYAVLKDIIHFVYCGQVSVDNAKLDTFLKTAQMLQISGLSNDGDETAIEDASGHEDEGTAYEETITPDVTVNENVMVKRAAKRVKTQETNVNEKKVREDNVMMMTDIKSEPNELMHFEDPLEDPLLQADPQADMFRQQGMQNPAEEDIKLVHVMNVLRYGSSSSESREQRLDGKLHVLSNHPQGKRKDCVVCSDRTSHGIRRVTSFMCETCERHPTLHPGDCFKIYHTQDIYKLSQKTMR